MERTLEPEIMEDDEQTAAYAKADFSDSNNNFVNSILAEFSQKTQSILDIGCGPADIPVLLATRLPQAKITAVDGSLSMLNQARAKIERKGLQDRIRVVHGRLPGLGLDGGDWSLILSKDLLHHLPDPMIFWREVAELASSETAVYVMDLYRPATQEKAREIVESVSGGEAEILKTDFYNSLLAAFTPEEVESQLKEAKLPLSVNVVSNRHYVVKGVLSGISSERLS